MSDYNEENIKLKEIEKDLDTIYNEDDPKKLLTRLRPDKNEAEFGSKDKIKVKWKIKPKLSLKDTWKNKELTFKKCKVDFEFDKEFVDDNVNIEFNFSGDVLTLRSPEKDFKCKFVATKRI